MREQATYIFGLREQRQTSTVGGPNHREVKINQLQLEFKALRQQFKQSEEEEKAGLAELRIILRKKLTPSDSPRKSLGRSEVVNLSALRKRWISTSVPDRVREQDLGPCSTLTTPPEPTVAFNTKEPTLKVARAARTSSAPGPSGVPYTVYKRCPRLRQRLWRIIKVIWRRGKVAQQWRYTEGVWIPKEENSSTIEQFRNISLLSVEGKIFFSIVF